MSSKLIKTRKPNADEFLKGAEIVFERKDEQGSIHTIFARKCCGSWEQWGTWKEILGDNMEDVERWRFPNRA